MVLLRNMLKDFFGTCPGIPVKGPRQWAALSRNSSVHGWHEFVCIFSILADGFKARSKTLQFAICENEVVSWNMF